MTGNAIINKILTGLSTVSSSCSDLRERIIDTYGKWVAYEVDGKLRYQRYNITIASHKPDKWIPILELESTIASLPELAGDDVDAIIEKIDAQFFAD